MYISIQQYNIDVYDGTVYILKNDIYILHFQHTAIITFNILKMVRRV